MLGWEEMERDTDPLPLRCTTIPQPGSGAVTLMVVNPSSSPVDLSVSGVVSSTPRLEYVFGGDINSTFPVLNGGDPLRINLDGSLPPMVRVGDLVH